MDQESTAFILFAFGVVRLATAVPHEPGWVVWDHASDHVVSAARDPGAARPNARQLSNGEILLAYHHGESLGNCGSRVTFGTTLR